MPKATAKESRAVAGRGLSSLVGRVVKVEVGDHIEVQAKVHI
jgi:hypothetical protein